MLPILFSIFAIFSTPAFSSDWLDYSAHLKEGDLCKVEPKMLHPTQFAVGEREVQARGKTLAKLSKEELKDYLKKKIVPIVIGPEGVPYIIDNHHLCKAILEGDLRDTVYAKVMANYSDLNVDEFWKKMQRKLWVYLFDENGKGPLDPRGIPRSLTQLKNDYFRSLVWELREAGYLLKVDVPYAEFVDAQYLRTRMTIEDSKEGWKKAIEEGRRLVRSPDAKDIPGYINCSKML